MKKQVAGALLLFPALWLVAWIKNGRRIPAITSAVIGSIGGAILMFPWFAFSFGQALGLLLGGLLGALLGAAAGGRFFPKPLSERVEFADPETIDSVALMRFLLAGGLSGLVCGGLIRALGPAINALFQDESSLREAMELMSGFLMLFGLFGGFITACIWYWRQRERALQTTVLWGAFFLGALLIANGILASSNPIHKWPRAILILFVTIAGGSYGLVLATLAVFFRFPVVPSFPPDEPILQNSTISPIVSRLSPLPLGRDGKDGVLVR